MADAARILPNEGMRFANAAVDIVPMQPATRLSVRGTVRGCREFAKSLGLSLPTKPGQISSATGKTILWLGPDEWLVIDLDGSDKYLENLPDGEKGCAVTDVSHRSTAFSITGNGAVSVLNAANPRDLSLSAFPINTGSRTIFGKAEVVLMRRGETDFYLECWRSFTPYVFEMLRECARDIP